ncbi:deoxyguanosine kinase-like isoform X2 [Corticium candelabrum]|uniref:deoxyguanosine kinase-like isoform X2 n=1 Tax=Corticium candelabrum TaxID=121492 RepID=UPI002E262431|nr:deoxyguanosine kinase-like isoform X2 [Corticium candelabrum]
MSYPDMTYVCTNMPISLARTRTKLIVLSSVRAFRLRSLEGRLKRNVIMQAACFSSKSKLVVVEGNIGAGKTTLTLELAERMSAKALLEPISQNPFLEKFYSDPKKYAFQLQLWIFRRRLELYSEALNHMLQQNETVILDRSVFGDCVFAEVGHNDGNISNEEYAIYQQLCKRMSKIFPVPDVLIFLDMSPTCCHRRIISRGRVVCLIIRIYTVKTSKHVLLSLHYYIPHNLLLLRS